MGMTIPTTFILPSNKTEEYAIAEKLARIEYKNESIEYVRNLIFSKK
jgi:hypothetical protein